MLGVANDPTVAAATTQRSRSPAPASRKKNDKRNGNACSKSRPHSGSDFFSFQNLGNGMCKFHNFYSNKAHKCIFPCSYSENDSATEPFWRQIQHMPLPLPLLVRLTPCLREQMANQSPLELNFLLSPTSPIVISAASCQKSTNHWRPLGFFSRKLTDMESCYSMFDRELLAAHAAIQAFLPFL
jgi:hypothetical protein